MSAAPCAGARKWMTLTTSSLSVHEFRICIKSVITIITNKNNTGKSNTKPTAKKVPAEDIVKVSSSYVTDLLDKYTDEVEQYYLRNQESPTIRLLLTAQYASQRGTEVGSAIILGKQKKDKADAKRITVNMLREKIAPKRGPLHDRVLLNSIVQGTPTYAEKNSTVPYSSSTPNTENRDKAQRKRKVYKHQKLMAEPPRPEKKRNL
ncbi:hypothetical protein RUM43_000116 [Polyplax serrata]|uniref:Uncharacterized protein n=1 Tax=Polyplax serrata TaxID=468196 RepID=A0AAN8XML9_POLSC